MQGEESLIAHTGSKCCQGQQGVAYDNTFQSKLNLNQTERILSTVVGGLLFKRNITNCSLGGLLKLVAGGALMRRGITGHCNVYEALKVNSNIQNNEAYPGASQKAVPVRAQMTVQMPPFETYQLWRDPANQAWIMGHFAKVDSISTDRAHWKLRSPINLEWDALIVADSPGEFISWETLPGAGLPNEGTVRFMPTETGGTRVIFQARFDQPAGALAMSVMKLIGVTPESVLEKALRRFKNMAEMGLPKAPIGPQKMKETPSKMQTAGA
jgi:uncharacterized membrane protein